MQLSIRTNQKILSDIVILFNSNKIKSPGIEKLLFLLLIHRLEEVNLEAGPF